MKYMYSSFLALVLLEALHEVHVVELDPLI
jgi:hypothetical protein